MNILVDTHIWIWWSTGESVLPTAAKRLIADVENSVYLSSISVWEAAIKITRGELRLDIPLEELSSEPGFRKLDFNRDHAIALLQLENMHKDPFDRALVAQASCEPLSLLTADKALAACSRYADVIVV